MGAFASHSGLHTVRVGRVLSARVGLRLIETQTHFRVGLVGVDCASNSPANFRARGTTRSCVDADFTTGGRRLSATHREGARDRPRTMQRLELSSRARQDGAAREHAADAEAIAARIIARRDAAAGRDARSREAAVRLAAAEARRRLPHAAARR